MVVPVSGGSNVTFGASQELFLDRYRKISVFRNPGYVLTPDGEFLMIEETNSRRLWAEVVFNLSSELAELVPLD